MKESPIFAQIKSAKAHSSQPLRDAFTQWANLKQVLISLFGALAGQGVIWYTSTFYALFYMQTILHLNPRTAYIVVVIALSFGVPFYVAFGALSDRIGRKKLIMAAMLLTAITIIPIYRGMTAAAGNNVVSVSSVRNRVTGDIRLTPLMRDAATGTMVPAPEAPHPNIPVLAFLLWIQIIYACMAYGPIAAYLVEAFPARVRYTSISLPYHIGNGVFGGLLPLIGLSLCASTHNIYAGLYYPMTVCALCLVCGVFFLRETRGTLIWNEVTKPVDAALIENQPLPQELT
jgi:MFS family permease